MAAHEAEPRKIRRVSQTSRDFRLSMGPPMNFGNLLPEDDPWTRELFTQQSQPQAYQPGIPTTMPASQSLYPGHSGFPVYPPPMQEMIALPAVPG